MRPDQVTVELLPSSLREIAALAGMAATLAIVEAYGGIELYIPSGELSADHDLVKLVGRRAAESLQLAYPGETLIIPLAARAARAIRNAEMRRDRAVLSAAAIARKYRTTERNVRAICAALADDRQQPLF